MTAMKERLVSLLSKTPSVSMSPMLMLPSPVLPSTLLIFFLSVVFNCSCALVMPFFTSAKSFMLRFLSASGRNVEMMKYFSRRCPLGSTNFLWLSSST